MAQFYSDKIDEDFNKIDTFLINKDLDLTKMIEKHFKNYVFNQKTPNKREFNKEFDKIYSINEKVVKNVQKTFNAQLKKNSFKTEYENHDLKPKNKMKTINKETEDMIKEIPKMIYQLKNNSWLKLQQTINLFDEELEKKIND